MFQWSSKRTSGSSDSRTAPTIRGSVRPPAISRDQHIDSYLLDINLKKSTRKVSADDTTFDTVFSTVSKVTLILRVHIPLGDHFVPSMSLAGATGNHAWLDNRMGVVGYPPIHDEVAWAESGVRLGEAVRAVVEHLQLNPPTNIQISDPGLRGIQPADSPATNGNSFSSRKETQPPPPQYDNARIPEIDLPAIPHRFKELDTLNRAEIDVLQADELSFLAFCNRLEVTKTYRKIATSILEENAKTAEKLLKQEDKVKSLEKQNAERAAELKEAVREFRALEEKQDALCSPPDYTKIKSELDDMKRSSYRESEELAEAWTEDGGDVDKFLKEFISSRTRHHVLAAKLELLSKR